MGKRTNPFIRSMLGCSAQNARLLLFMLELKEKFQNVYNYSNCVIHMQPRCKPKRVTDTQVHSKMYQYQSLTPLGVNMTRMYEGGVTLAKLADFLMILSFMTCTGYTCYLLVCIILCAHFRCI